MKKTVFLDRDGIIVENIDGEAPTKTSDLKLINISIQVIKKLQKRGFKVIVVSNQPDVALGLISEKTKVELVKKFKELLLKENVKIDVYYCFHHTKGINIKYTKNCICHKPKPGMLLKAINKYNIDPELSYMVGDRASDIKAGDLSGVNTILLDPNGQEKRYLGEYKVEPDFIIKKVDEVLNII